MAMQKTGGCHCGAVRYTVSKEPELTFYCHYQDCQKTTGSPFSVEMMLGEDAFDVEGEVRLSSYTVAGDSGKAVNRWHCSACASGIYLTCDADPGYVFLKVGTLDDATWASPDMHIYTATCQPWLHLSDDLPRYSRAPED